MNKKLMQGTFWLTFANLLCKVLGVVYLIPWLSMMGNNQDGMLATTLYNVGYLPYGLFLMLGTVGFPNAIAKKSRWRQKMVMNKLVGSFFAVRSISCSLSGSYLPY